MKKRAFIILLAVLTIAIMVLSLTNMIEQSLGMCIALGLIVIFNIVIAIGAFKSDVKLIAYLMVFLAVLGVILLAYNIMGYIKMNKVNGDYKFQLIAKPENKEKTLLFNFNGHDYYVYNVEDVNVILKSDGKTYTLKDALNNQLLTLEEILKLSVPNENTIGYKIYYDGGQPQYENDQYSLVICENEKNDIIFSTFNYTYEDEICK